MTVVKKRRVGSSTVLTVPKDIDSPFEKYEVYAGRNGAIVFLPKRPNPFTDKEFIKNNTGALTNKDFVPTEILKDEF